MADTFANILGKSGLKKPLQKLILDLSGSFSSVSSMLKNFETGAAGTQNVYGEKQLKVDVAANDLFLGLLQGHSAVASIASEELEEEFHGKSGSDGYSVAFDPLDGSSLVDVNLSIGSIFGIYKGEGFVGRKTDEQVAAIIVVYGPRLTFMISFGQGVQEFLYDEKSSEFIFHADIKFGEDKKLFSPGNLRACSSEKWYTELLEYWVKNNYTLRYSGGMVPDVNQILKKGSGVFTYPGYKEKPNGKLRLLFECAPMAFLTEQAGGAAVNGVGGIGVGGRILDMTIEKLDQTTPVFLGDKKSVELVRSFMK